MENLKASVKAHTQRSGWRTEVYDKDPRIIVYPATQDRPPVPYDSPLNPRNFNDHTQYLEFRHLPPHFTYLALIPRVHPFADQLFHCLAYEHLDLPINYTPKMGYHLNLSVQESWLQTFSVIRRTGNYLGGIAKSNIPPQRPWTWPEECGFTYFHKTRDAARDAAFLSQQAFIPWVAYTTFFIGLIEYEQAVGIAQHVEWRYNLRKSMAFDESWGVAMERSGMFDRKIQRLGAYLSIGRDKYTDVAPDELVMIQVLRSFEAPIYLDWGRALELDDIKGLAANLPFDHMRPSRLEVRLLLAASERIYPERDDDVSEECGDNEGLALSLANGSQPAHPCDSLSPGVNNQPLTLPLPDDTEATRPGNSLPPGVEAQLTKNGRVVYVDTRRNTTSIECPSITPSATFTSPATKLEPHDFFKERAARNAKSAQNEDAKQRQRRMDKQRGAHGKAPIRNAAFFLWAKRDGLWVREELDREDGVEVFLREDFTKSQTVYDAFSNVYDFCQALDPTAVSFGMLDDEEMAEEVYGTQVNSAPMLLDDANVHPRSFWAQRVAEFGELEAHESPDERLARQDRESAGESTMRPDSNASVFIWEMRAGDGTMRDTLPAVGSDERATIRWVRKQLDSTQVDACLSTAQSTQVRFDPFRNEWDVCWAFDPTCVARGIYQVYQPQLDKSFVVGSASSALPSDRDNADMDTDMPTSTECSNESLNRIAPFFDEEKMLHDLGWNTERHLDLPDVNRPVNGEGLLTEFFENFGISVSAAHGGPPGADTPFEPLLQAVGFHRYGRLDISPLSWLTGSQWETLLFAFSRIPLVAPESLPALDSALSNAFDLANINSSLFCAIDFPITKACFDDDEKKSFWLIDSLPQPGRPRWHLAIPLARTVVLIRRMGWGPDPTRIIRELVRRCIPFFWLVDAAKAISHPAIRPEGNGTKPGRYEPTTQDFLVAEMNKIHFLRGPRGYAAFFEGSLFARWANEYADVSQVLAGPSRDALWPGRLRRLLINANAGPLVYDPCLTDAEIETLTGAVEIVTDYTQKGCVSSRSWWPPPHIWNNKFITPGMWGVAAEQWLKTRRMGLLGTRPKWNANSDWNKALLTKAKDAGTYREHYDKCCERYLEVVLNMSDVL